MKEMLKVFIYLSMDSFNIEIWERLFEETNIQSQATRKRVSEIYTRESEHYKKALELTENNEKYNDNWRNKYGITKRTFSYAQQIQLGQQSQKGLTSIFCARGLSNATESDIQRLINSAILPSI